MIWKKPSVFFLHQPGKQLAILFYDQDEETWIWSISHQQNKPWDHSVAIEEQLNWGQAWNSLEGASQSYQKPLLAFLFSRRNGLAAFLQNKGFGQIKLPLCPEMTKSLLSQLFIKYSHRNFLFLKWLTFHYYFLKVTRISYFYRQLYNLMWTKKGKQYKFCLNVCGFSSQRQLKRNPKTKAMKSTRIAINGWNKVQPSLVFPSSTWNVASIPKFSPHFSIAFMRSSASFLRSVAWKNR